MLIELRGKINKKSSIDPPEGELLKFAEYHPESHEKTLYCRQCDELWVEYLPKKYPLHLLECRRCRGTDCITDRIPKD